MSLPRSASWFISCGFPRVSGDEPGADGFEERPDRFSPREWG